MDFEEYRQRGKEMVDYIADYLENIRERRVFPDVKPGYMHNLLPESAPVDGEKWDNIMNDIERVIMPGITHWQSPHMHAYFPALNSFPSMLGDMLADAINCLGFTWASSPACTELETIVMNWLGKMIGLPDDFLHLNSGSKGGGVIQTTASEATLVCLLAGRTQAIKKFHEQTPGYQDAEINARLVAYCSDQAHSSVEKAALIGLVRMRYIESDDELVMRGKPLKEAIDNDIKQGLIPFWVCNTLGTTGACAFDNLDEIGNVCREFGLWLHIDAAYAGSALICPEYRTWLKGVEKANSIAFNPSKWLMVHFDCTAMWVKDSTAVHRTFNVEPLYLQHENSGLALDYMHWQIPLSKRFRSLKLWFVLRSFGIKGLQKHIREGVRLAQKFEALVLADHRFEIPAKRHLGMVVFRIKGDNELTEKLLKRLNHRGKLHCVPSSLKGKYIIRFTVTSTRTTIDDILEDWTEIKLVTADLLDEMNVKIDRAKVSLKDTKEKNEAFGSSLLLSNSPMSPKVVNGSFAAIFDADEFLAKTYAGIRIAKSTTLETNLPPLRPLIKRPTNFTNFQHQDSPSMRRRVRGILMSGKQFSLDSRMDLVVHSCYDSNNENQKANAIREDNEEVLEVYESPGTPPITPPPMISPMINHHFIRKQQKHRFQQPRVNPKFLSKLPMNSTITVMSPTNVIPEILDQIRIPNKYKMVDNFTNSSKTTIKNPKIEAKTSTENYTDETLQTLKCFDKISTNKNISPTLKNFNSVETNCRNCNLSLKLKNPKKCSPLLTKDTVISITGDNLNKKKNEKDFVKNSTELSRNDSIDFDFKSTVNTVIVKQNLNVSSNSHKYKSKNKIKTPTNTLNNSFEENCEKIPIAINCSNIISNKCDIPILSSPPPLSSQIYHGKRFLEQSTNDGIFAFYNLAFRAANSFQHKNSMSDISEEDISLVDSVDWEAIKTNFHKSSATSSAASNSAQNLSRSALAIAKIKQQQMQFSSSQSSTDSIQKEIETELKKLPASRQSLFLSGLKIRVDNEDGKKIKTSFDSTPPSNSSEENKRLINRNSDKNSSKDSDEDAEDEDDETNGNESDNEEQENLHSTTSSSSSSTTSSTSPISCFSQPISLWSSLEVTELLQETGGSSTGIQIGPDGWTIVAKSNNKKENSKTFDICQKCGHNSNSSPNDTCEVVNKNSNKSDIVENDGNSDSDTVT